MSQTSFFSSRAARTLALLLVFGAALAIRLYDLTDLPLDFHPTRQLLSASKARGLYYQTKPEGISQWELRTAIRSARLKADIEPVVFEQVVAFTYRFTGEKLWIARIYASLFWLTGGIFLFLLIRDYVSFEGALVSTAYYLIFPYAIVASRSFQPDPLMVMLVLAFWWVFSRWVRFPAWSYAILAGLVGGLAVFIKFSAAFFVVGGALGLALSRLQWRDMLRNTQLWVMALLGALPPFLYLVYGVFIRGDLASQFKGRFFLDLLFSPYNYLLWETKASMAAGGVFIMLGLLGLLLVKDSRVRSFLYGIWAGYIVYGLYFNYQIANHDYYNMMLIPIVAVSLAPLGTWFFTHITEAASQRWMRGALSLVLIYGLLSVIWDVRNQFKAVDYRPEAAMWWEIGEQFEEKARIVGLTQNYGARLEYWGLQRVSAWPYLGDPAYANIRAGVFSFDDLFERYASKMNFFLITDFEEFDRQPQLKERLYNSYPVYHEGDGYLIFDLRNPLQQDGNGS